jgi:hypothetical protein
LIWNREVSFFFSITVANQKILVNKVLIKGSLEPHRHFAKKWNPLDKPVSQGGSTPMVCGLSSSWFCQPLLLSADVAACPLARDHTYPNAKLTGFKYSYIARRHANNPCPFLQPSSRYMERLLFLKTEILPSCLPFASCKI